MHMLIYIVREEVVT